MDIRENRSKIEQVNIDNPEDNKLTDSLIYNIIKKL